MALPSESRPEMRRVAVWGASGFIGRHVVATLLDRGHQVRGLTRNPGKAPASRNERFEAHALDFGASPHVLRRALEGASCAIYCAGHATAGDDDHSGYVASVGNLAEAAAGEGLERLVLISTVAVYGSRHAGMVGVETELRPDTPYARSRMIAEDAARKALARSDTRLTLFRVPAVVGADMRADVLRRVFRTLRSGFFLHPGRTEAVFPCVGVHRLAECIARVAEAGNRALPPVLQLSDSLRWSDLANQYGVLTGRKVLRIALPGKAIGRVCRMLGFDLARPLAALDGRVCYEDNSEVLATRNQVPDTLRDIRELIGQLG
jgi:UDP-glucose 4-epimerase